MKEVDYVKAEEIAKVVLDIRDRIRELDDSISNVIDVYMDAVNGLTDEQAYDFDRPLALRNSQNLNEWLGWLEEVQNSF